MRDVVLVSAIVLGAGVSAAACGLTADFYGIQGGTRDAGAPGSNLDAGSSGAPCTASCGTLTCCGGACVELTRDPRNCGGCGNVCTVDQFCTGATCEDAVLANVCANPAATVVLDPYYDDNDAGILLGAALATSCSPATSVSQVPLAGAQNVIDLGSGRPLLGPGNTLVTGGGGYGQPSVAYMDQQGLTALYLVNDGTTATFVNRATGTNVVSTPLSDLDARHDYFFLEVSVEPTSGTLCFSGVGILSPGTLAAGYFGNAEVVPNRASYTHVWYAYEWTDTNNDGTPDSGDTFTLIGAGP